ncbi:MULTISPECIES: CsbD family protein [Thermomonospora]|uniref:CsbD family protein n=1 Tax=Thermomonospora curvata (strain ATCC 19995 / DSM 43183 / JCM 3096 / KCTC 9072 / NBRC 15933 / NCIMB 10081 / Henssen B9) TaxID=471852 RepID=D1ACY2_THECD|nr:MULTISPECIES: CsbD family protein [Thermomonospora]ACY99291.1 CsbD family protein [Thermomonospora curvata DSM 43183]PKK12349.1 MAG: CsbD family protein [Thermomonospora sp. CIF 1]
MSFLDKLKNKAQQITGRGKEEVGRRTGDSGLESEGRGERATGGMKQAGERVKDAAKDVRRGFGQ